MSTRNSYLPIPVRKTCPNRCKPVFSYFQAIRFPFFDGIRKARRQQLMNDVDDDRYSAAKRDLNGMSMSITHNLVSNPLQRFDC